MKPTDILKILDLAKTANDNGFTFNPLFAGDAGLGKSDLCKMWVKEQQKEDPNFGFIDLRLAYMEPPDFVGMPQVVTSNGKERMKHVLPEMWPDNPDSKGLLLIEEPNRAPQCNMNALMQLLTDRKIHMYTLPKGWVVAGCINPDNANYEVNAMDTALRDRFEIYEINYDKNGFVTYMKDNNWSTSIINFVESGMWQFKKPDELGEEGKYIAPRTFSKLNAAEQSNIADFGTDIYFGTIVAELGTHIGREYYNFVTDNRPIMAHDFITDPEHSFKKLKEYTSSNNYRGDVLSITIKSVADEYPKNITNEVLADICEILPVDQAISLLYSIVMKVPASELSFDKLLKKMPKLEAGFKARIKEGKDKK